VDRCFLARSGKSVLLKRGGTDATEDFEQWHEQSVLSRIGKKFLVGRVAGILPVETAASSGQGQAVLTAGRAKPATQMPVPNLMFDQSPFSEPAWMQQYTPFSPYYGESHIKFRWVRHLLFLDPGANRLISVLNSTSELSSRHVRSIYFTRAHLSSAIGSANTSKKATGPPAPRNSKKSSKRAANPTPKPSSNPAAWASFAQ
jgi:hypothetical protein